MRTAVIGLCFNQLQNLEVWFGYLLKSNVDLIILGISEFSFRGFKSNTYKEECNFTELIMKSNPNRVIIVKGFWSNEESMRNELLNKARDNKINLLGIIDLDEFYEINTLNNVLEHIISKKLPPNTSIWIAKEEIYRYFNVKILGELKRIQGFVILSNETLFIKMRLTTGSRYYLKKDFYFWHLGYVGSENFIKTKIDNFSHSLEVPHNWYIDKWLNWKPGVYNLCRKGTSKWFEASVFDYSEDLPKYLTKFHPFRNILYNEI